MPDANPLDYETLHLLEQLHQPEARATVVIFSRHVTWLMAKSEEYAKLFMETGSVIAQEKLFVIEETLDNFRVLLLEAADWLEGYRDADDDKEE